jgi:Flp pilus assembly protein protease CpaA
MERLADFVALICAVVLAVQDFRTRLISPWIVVLLGLALALAGSAQTSFTEIGTCFLINLAFIATQFLFLTLWFSLRERKFVSLIDTHIGLGDVFFLVAVAFAFAPVNFIVYYSLGLTCTLLVALLWFAFRKSFTTIPLAAALAIPLIVLCTWRVAQPQIQFHSDAWLTNWLETTYS